MSSIVVTLMPTSGSSCACAIATNPHGVQEVIVGDTWVRVAERRTYDGGIVAVHADVTEMKDRQQELQRAKDDAERATQVKSEFLANMSHELRTPLNAIIGYSQILQEDAEDADQSAMVPDLKKIENAGNHLLGLINSILDLSKIEAGRMEVFIETRRCGGLDRGCAHDGRATDRT